MDTWNMTQNHKNMLAALDEVCKLTEYDSYYLTRDEQDSIFYRVQALKEHVNGIYRKKASNGQ